MRYKERVRKSDTQTTQTARMDEEEFVGNIDYDEIEKLEVNNNAFFLCYYSLQRSNDKLFVLVIDSVIERI